MNVSIWDTYVTRKSGELMHFDIIVPHNIKDQETIFTFGKDYLQSRGEDGQQLDSRECRFCHVEEASDAMLEAIREKGYFIIELENCV